MIELLGQGGRLGVAIGVAGAGKSTILAPLVDARRGDGLWVWDLAWRWTEDLAHAGIAEATGRRRCSWSAPRTAHRARPAVAVSDELGRLGRAAVPRLDALAGAGAASRWTGSGSEAVPVAGPTIGILERALGPDAVPQLLSTVRQQGARERETSLMFR